MNAKSDEPRASEPRASARGEAARAGARKRLGTRGGQYLIAAVAGGEEALNAKLRDLGGVEIVRTLAPRGAAPPVAVVQATADKATALRQAAFATLIVEEDEPLYAASAARAGAATAARAFGPGFTATIQVVGESEEPVARAQVQLIGRQWSALGLTGNDGRAALTLYGETPETVTDLLVIPRSDYWGMWRTRPRLQEGETTVALRSLAQASEPSWGDQAMRFDQLPPDYRGDGIKIALIDTGVATSHSQLAHLDQGFAAGDGAAWSQDAAGHGTPCAGIIAAAPDPDNHICGYAPHAQLHVVSLPPDARLSDLVAALDYCLGAGIDIACLGFGCTRGSAIVEQRVVAAKQRGMALVAAAGSTGGPVQFPACSRNVLAVGAVGRAGTFPDESTHAVNARAEGGLFVPAFSCCGPEIDVVAPGVAVISCQSPHGSVAADGTSLAAAHVAALAALVLAHHADFQREFAARNALRVERLFQILKLTARPLGDPARTGAGLPDAAHALGLPAQLGAPPLDSGLEEMRAALRRTGIFGGGARAPLAPEPPRGPAMIAHLPLRAASPAIGATDVAAAMRELGAAMAMAGLSQRTDDKGRRTDL